MSHIQTPVSTVLEDIEQLHLFCRMKNQKRIKRDVVMKDDQRIALTKKLLRKKLHLRVTRGNGWNLHAATFTSILIY